MKRVLIQFCSYLLLTSILSAQKSELIKVSAGLKAEDCIPFQQRYRFPEFTTGTVYFKSGSDIEAKLNYNLMLREMQYIKGKDTLTIVNETDIQQIIISGTVFVANEQYLELIYTGKFDVGMKQYFNLMNVRKKDFYGDIGSGAATTSYNSLHSEGQYNRLTVNQDKIFQKVAEYYLQIPSGNWVRFNKKKVKQLYPRQKKAIDDYLRSNMVNFDSEKDLIRFAVYLGNL